MKRKSLFLLSIITITATISYANADSMLMDWYVGGTFGTGAQTHLIKDNNTSSNAMSFGGIFGVDIPLFRIETEYNYLHTNSMDTNVGMLNAYFKIPMLIVTPYIGAGAGIIGGGSITPKDMQNSFDIKTTTAYQGMLGMTMDIPVLPLKFDIEGRALYSYNFYDNTITHQQPDLLQYDLRLKLRYIF